jgi:hypothetical protein
MARGHPGNTKLGFQAHSVVRVLLAFSPYPRDDLMANGCLAGHAASVADCDIIVSWNFRHIVHFDKIRGYNAVNIREGYGVIAIHSPKEVV